MQTDVTSSQLVAAATPVPKLSLPNPLPEGKESFDFHIELIIQNETSEELNDIVLKEPVVESSGEESEPTTITETETDLAVGLTVGQPVDREVIAVDRRGLPVETQAFNKPATHINEAESVKVASTAQTFDISEKNTAPAIGTAPAIVEPARREVPPLESIKVEQPHQINPVAVETGISPTYQRGFVTQNDGQTEGAIVGNVRQVQEDVVSERPNNVRTPKMFDKEAVNFAVQPPVKNPQQPVSEPRIPPLDGKTAEPESALTETAPKSNVTKTSSQFQAPDAKQLDVANSAPLPAPAKEAQRPTSREATPSTTGALPKLDIPVEPSRNQIVVQTSTPSSVAQVVPDRPDVTGTKTDPKILAGFRPTQTGTVETAAIIPVPAPDVAVTASTNTVSIPSFTSSARISVDQKPSVPFSDQRWGNSATSLAVKPVSTPATPPEFVGNVVNGVVSQPLDVAPKTLFLDEGRTDEIPVLSKESLTLSGPVRSVETVFTHPGAARAVASQMVEALSNAQSKRIEIALNPEELGRVRMVLSTTDAGVSVSILAERPETLDLMRRHIDQLTEEFRNLGYVDIGFEFSGDGTNSRFDEGSEGHQGFSKLDPDDGPANALPGPETETSTRPPVLRGLDMRL